MGKVNWEKAFDKIDKEVLEYYQMLTIYRTKELLIDIIMQCNDKQKLKKMLILCAAYEGMDVITEPLTAMRLVEK